MTMIMPKNDTKKVVILNQIKHNRYLNTFISSISKGDKYK